MTTRSKYLLALLIFGVTLAVFWRTAGNGFINFDDPSYVFDNPHVLGGLDAANINWAFHTWEMGNWHPVTWLSHMADCTLYGAQPGGHHLTSALLHSLNALLLFIFLMKATGKTWSSALVAALFALHPLHVESVAWVAERKDVLSTFFMLLALLAYLRYVERKTVARYLTVFSAFAMGLLAKPMLVTFPFVLLLLDFWPLRRLDGPEEGAPQARSGRLLLEKIPLLCLSLVFCWVTIYAQKAGGAVASVTAVPLEFRIANAVIAYGAYLVKTVWPADLAVLYPLPKHVSPWQVSAAGILIASVTVAAVRFRHRLPYLMVGWLWYLGTLLPVIGLVQVGTQSMADRYTYIPLIGIFLVVAWGGADLAARLRLPRIAVAGVAASVLVVLATLTFLQIGVWKDSVSLFEDALRHTSGNNIAHLNLGMELMAQGRVQEARDHYLASLEIEPNNYLAHLDLGVALASLGREQEAIQQYGEALRLNPASEEAHFHLGAALLSHGDAAQALDHYAQAIAVNPEYFYGQYNMGLLLASMGRNREAVEHFLVALRLRPNLAEIRRNLGVALARDGRYQDAAAYLAEAIRLDPADEDARKNLELVRLQLNRGAPLR